MGSLQQMSYPDPITEEEHTKVCKPGEHLVQQEYHGPRTCTVCEHRVNRDDVAMPERDCPESCFERYEAESDL